MVHSLDFADELYYINTGFIKRYCVTEIGSRSLQAIYGPGQFFPLTPIFKNYLDLTLGESQATYLYEAMSDVEICKIPNDVLTAALEKTPELYKDLLFEAGQRLRSNIHSLENNAYQDAEKKIAHHVMFLAEEFGDDTRTGIQVGVTLPFKMTIQDFVDQLNVASEDAEAAIAHLKNLNILICNQGSIVIPDMDMLRDVYLAN
jgi:CRP-like cAMP-binding protein